MPGTQTFSFSAVAGPEATLWLHSIPDGKATQLPNVRSTFPLNSAVSPSGRWIAYGTRRPEAVTIFVEPLPPTGTRYEVPAAGGGAHHPGWGRDDAELFFNQATGPLTAVKLRTAPTVEFSAPTPVAGAFSANTTATSARNYDLSPDGTRFITLDGGDFESGRETSPSISVVLNWFEELKRLAPPRSATP